ncbi:MAG: chemotaxis protein CheB [Nitrospirota bacterium]
MPGRSGNRVIALGASAGGIGALSKVIAALPEDIPAPLFIVQHVSPESPGVLDQILGRAGRLPVKYAEHGEHFHTGAVYIAPPDRHLIVKKDHLVLSRGPRENRTRPAVDPLFRSAAAAYGAHVVGVVLTGLLDDGTAGLATVKRCGGISCIQDPRDAEFPGMPRSALESVDIDVCLPLGELPSALDRLARQPVAKEVPIPEDVILESQIAERAMSDIGVIDTMAEKAPFVCPECGGGLWEMKNDTVLRYRCNTGHAYSKNTLLSSQNNVVESALWAAVRSLEERAGILSRMARNSRERGGRSSSAREWEKEAGESKAHARQIRDLIMKGYAPQEAVTDRSS